MLGTVLTSRVQKSRGPQGAYLVQETEGEKAAVGEHCLGSTEESLQVFRQRSELDLEKQEMLIFAERRVVSGGGNGMCKTMEL